jgi:lipopolysaccharide transport system ATP-binding protein
MSDIVIAAENLSKRYLVGHQAQRESYTALRDVLAREARNFARKGLDFVRGRQIVQGDEVEEFWALRDVSFEVRRGEVLGIIGRNGAGKSTLLKILSRITEPTRGRITIRGRVSSLLEVGTGFHPELTGRENIYLNGAILGMTQREIRTKFDEIVAFAEVEQFLDTPVKRYSSGMYVRLAFAVAAHLEPEILVVDEVLAVGDHEFQKKCLGKMEDVARGGRTILFVSHNMAAVQNLCIKGILLDRGSVVVNADIRKCISVYTDCLVSGSRCSWIRGDQSCSNLWFKKADISKLEQTPTSIDLMVDVELQSKGSYSPSFLAVDVVDSIGGSIMQALPEPTPFIFPDGKSKKFRIALDLPKLIPGTYFLTLWVGSHYTMTYDKAPQVIGFDITDSPTIGRTFPHSRENGQIVPSSRVIRLPCEP